MNSPGPRSARWLARAARISLTLLWLQEGLSKLAAPEEVELTVVRGVFAGAPISPRTLLSAIGVGELLVATAVASGFAVRPLCWLQAVLIVAMNGLGAAFGGGAIADPARLFAHNLPVLVTIATLGVIEVASP